MAIGSFGADSSVPVTSLINGQSLVAFAQQQYSQTPVFWGRYFKSLTEESSAEYRHLEENQLLRDNNIPVLPIAQQTPNVDGSQALGVSDAKGNVDDILASFGASYLATLGAPLYVFLDIEGVGTLSGPSVSEAYYTGWAQTLVSYSLSETANAVQLTPCVYARYLDAPTWKAIAAAMAAGVPCAGAWIARYPNQVAGCYPLRDWDPSLGKPPVTLPCPVFAWQYCADCGNSSVGIDCSVTNPAINLQNDLIAHLILPPDMTGTL